jgi:hypothetical protein
MITTDKLISEVKQIGSTIIQDKSTQMMFKLPSAFTKIAAEIYEVMGVTRSTKPEPI